MLLAGVATRADAEKQTLELASPFVQGAVLQRDMKVPIWGWATSGSDVTVAFAGQSKSARADKKGKWMVHLDPMLANANPQTLTVTSSTIKHQPLTITDVLSGVPVGSFKSVTQQHYQP